MDLIKNSFLEAQQVLEAFISDEKNLGQVKNAGDHQRRCRKESCN